LGRRVVAAFVPGEIEIVAGAAGAVAGTIVEVERRVVRRVRRIVARCLVRICPFEAAV
jgi:hypothetical protein